MNHKVKPFSSVVIIGFGDIGQRVAAIWQDKDLTVSGLARSHTRHQIMQVHNITPIVADLNKPETLQNINLANALVYYFVPPPATGKTDPHMANFLSAIKVDTLPARIIAISTSGVYGDCQGETISEERATNPQANRAHRRLDMEQQLQAWAKKTTVPIIILRVGGIYSCERLPLERIKKGTPLLHEHLAPKTNRIHADDLTQVCVAAALKGKADNIYNVSDGCESNMTDYFITLANFFNLPHPPLVGWTEAEKIISKGMLSYLKESRRMDNTKMMIQLEINLKYPNLIAGLKCCK